MGDIAGNIKSMRRMYDEAVELGADVLVFPEMCICGYPPQDLLLKKDFLEVFQKVRAIENVIDDLWSAGCALPKFQETLCDWLQAFVAMFEARWQAGQGEGSPAGSPHPSPRPSQIPEESGQSSLFGGQNAG